MNKHKYTVIQAESRWLIVSPSVPSIQYNTWLGGFLQPNSCHTVEKSLQLLTCIVFGGNLNVAVCLSYSKASPPDCSLLLAHHKIRCVQQVGDRHYFESFFVLYIRSITILGVEVPSSGLVYVVSARLGNKYFGALLLFYKLVSGSASLLVFYGLRYIQ